MELAPVRNGVYPFVGGFTYLKLIYSRMGAKHILHKQRDPNHSWMIFIHLFFLHCVAFTVVGHCYAFAWVKSLAAIAVSVLLGSLNVSKVNNYESRGPIF